MDIRNIKGSAAKTAMRYLVATLLVLVFGLIYEHFSHGVYSGYMVFAFAFPLIGGFLPFLGMALAEMPTVKGTFHTLYDFGIASLTTGSIVQGILEIYGTTNHLTSYYWIVGAVMMIVGIIGSFAQRSIERKKNENQLHSQNGYGKEPFRLENRSFQDQQQVMAVQPDNRKISY
ncbi:MAG: hypothetical protein ACOYJI_01685 [Anaerovoracaceae bacterium]